VRNPLSASALLAQPGRSSGSPVMSGPAPASWSRPAQWRPPPDGLPSGQFAYLELLVLSSKLRSGKRRALRAAMHSRSMAEIWDMIRVSNDLTDLEDDVSQALGRY
jgi:hypothetical protein